MLNLEDLIFEGEEVQQAPAFVRKQGEDDFAREEQVLLVGGNETENIQARCLQSLFECDLCDLLLDFLKTSISSGDEPFQTFKTFLLLLHFREQSKKHLLTTGACKRSSRISVGFVHHERVD